MKLIIVLSIIYRSTVVALSLRLRFSDGGDGGDGDGVQQHCDHVGVEGGDGGDAGDGQCRAPRQHVGQHAEPDGASDQHEPTHSKEHDTKCWKEIFKTVLNFEIVLDLQSG